LKQEIDETHYPNGADYLPRVGTESGRIGGHLRYATYLNTRVRLHDTNFAPAANSWGFSLCGSQVACSWATTPREGTHDWLKQQRSPATAKR
jgi:hypothetical protein